MGCHGGLNIPDSQSYNPLLEGNPSPDFAQAFAAGGAAGWVANTGFGYGMDDAATNSELLMIYFTQELGAGSLGAPVTLGEALVNAKQRYLGSVSASGFGVYDEKSMIIATLYGLPMKSVSVPEPKPVVYDTLTLNSGSVEPTDFELDGNVIGSLVGVRYSGMLDQSLNQTDKGDFYSFGIETQALPGRPIQGRGSMGVQAPASYEAYGLRGALLWSASFEDLAGFNPVIARPVWDIDESEPIFEAEGWFPDQFWAANRFGIEERLVVVGGQFSGSQDLGTERLFNSVDLEAIFTHPDLPLAADYLPPAVLGARAVDTGNGGVVFSVKVIDLGVGVERVLVTYEVLNQDGSGFWQSLELAYDPQEETWTGSAAGVTEETPFFVQAMDRAGNVVVNTNNGIFFRGIKDNPITNEVGASHGFTVTTWKDFGDGLGFVPADGIQPEVTLIHTAGSSSINIIQDTCTSPGTELITNVLGQQLAQCSVEFNTQSPGNISVQAYAEITILDLTVSRFTDGLIGNSANALKTYVDARISIQADETSEIGQPQTFTVFVERHDGYQWRPALDGTIVFVTLTNTNGAGYILVKDTCITGTTGGMCSVTIVSNSAGAVIGSAGADIAAGNLVLNRQTDVTATKFFVDATIQIQAASAASGIGEPQTFLITVKENDGSGSGFVPAAGESVTVTLSGSNGAVVQELANTCASTDATGQCTVTFTSNTAGQVTGQAASFIQVSGQSLYRETDGTGGSSGAASITFISGSLNWLKVDSKGNPLGGATFEVCRTHDRFGDIPDECITVLDNDVLMDVAPGDGTIQLEGLKLGTYTVKEAIAPAGYLLDAKEETVILDLVQPGGVIANPWVNLRLMQSKVTSTNTTCEIFASGAAEDLTAVIYGVRQGKINNTAPGVFYYYTFFTAPSSSFTTGVLQTNSDSLFPLFDVQNNDQIRLYNKDCTNATVAYTLDITGEQVILNIQNASPGQEFILSVKYSTSNVVGVPVSKPYPTIHYDYITILDVQDGNGFVEIDRDSDGLNLAPK
jgi:hypothetical protein